MSYEKKVQVLGFSHLPAGDTTHCTHFNFFFDRSEIWWRSLMRMKKIMFVHFLFATFFPSFVIYSFVKVKVFDLKKVSFFKI